jgi:DNA relaxase NicK
MRLTFKLPNQDWVEELVGAFIKLLKDEPIWEYNQGSFYGKQWQHRGRSVKGLKWYWCNPGAGQSHAHLLIEATGRVVSQVPIRQLWDFCRFLKVQFTPRVTRFDVALDDYQKRIKERYVESAAKSRNIAIVERIMPSKAYSRRRDAATGGYEDLGFCYYIGSQQSDAFLRYYDKDYETDGEVPTYRLEAQFTDSKAQVVWLKWLSIEEDSFDELSPQFLSGSVLGLVEFVDRKDAKKNNKKSICVMKRLPWWKKFIKAVGSHIRHSVPREDRTFERMLGWLERQVISSLAMAQKVMGLLGFRGWLDEKMAEAVANFRREQEAKIVQWSKGRSDICQRTNGAIDMKDEEGERWIWVWRETQLDKDWGLARMLSANATSVKIRFSGESSKNISKRLTHFGKDKPTWVPASIGDMVKDLVDGGRKFVWGEGVVCG